MTTPTVYFNGALVPEADAQIGVDDGGWLHGAGLFETMRAEYGRVFRLESHVRRLMNSAAKLLRPIDRSDLPSPAQLEALLSRRGQPTARLRMTVTAGSVRSPHPGRVDSASETGGFNVCVSASELTTYPDKLYEGGAGVIVASARVSTSNPVAGHKTTSSLPRVLALREAQSAGCIEALWFTTDHRLAEGSISNVFIVKDGKLRAPPIDTPVLPGITRAAVMEIVRNSRVDPPKSGSPRDALTWEESALTIDDLLDADEVFITNVIMQIMPVVAIEKHVIADGRVGPVTRRIRGEFCDLVKKECSAS